MMLNTSTKHNVQVYKQRQKLNSLKGFIVKN